MNMVVTAAPITCIGNRLSIRVATAAIASDRVIPGSILISLLVRDCVSYLACCN